MIQAASTPRRNGTRPRAAQAEPSTVRVAVYVRRSVVPDESQRFTSLDAQADAIRAYIASRRAEGWVAVPGVYEDSGFTGANLVRPGFQRMMADAEAGKIDIVAVHRLDRLTRSQLDLLRTVRFLQEHGVAFLSISESFDTSNYMGRAMLSLLGTFAELERERIVERTREKLAAQRQKGLWTGGRPLLGYDIANKALVVNPEEADRVRAIFQMYLELGSQLAVVRECNRRGWLNKAYTTQAGAHRPGKPFTRTSIQKLLKRPQYISLSAGAD